MKDGGSDSDGEAKLMLKKSERQADGEDEEADRSDMDDDEHDTSGGAESGGGEEGK